MGSASRVLSSLERRLTAEWTLLNRLSVLNPGRLTGLSAKDLAFELQLHQTPGLLLPSPGSGPADTFADSHALTVRFPRFFPAAPMELYLATPVQHPNVHPETGFVCLWDRHRVSNTVEHALHKLVSMLGWQLYNNMDVHVMQPETLPRIQHPDGELTAHLAASPLRGVAPETSPAIGDGAAPQRRRRLS